MNKYLPRTPQAAQIKSHLQVSGKAHFSRKYGVFYLFTACKRRVESPKEVFTFLFEKELYFPFYGL